MLPYTSYNKLMPQLRQNIITGEWVVIAPERAKRPSDFVVSDSVKPTAKADCPFCVENELYKSKKLKGFESKRLYTINNSFPAFLEDPTHCSVRSHKIEDDFYNARPSTGGHDVLIHKDHSKQLYDFTVADWQEMFVMAKKRYRHWRLDCNTRYSMLIYNQGVKAGASIQHPHAQIMASNIIPNQISREIHGSQLYFEESGSCVFCDLVAHELEQKIRVLKETADFVAITFYAARFPFEIWILPKKHQYHFDVATDAMLGKLSDLMRWVTARLGRVLKKPSFNFFVHDLPTTVDKADYYHWHIEIAPRVSTYGGFELGSGTIIDVMSPEEACAYLLK